jgi:hypothetical protein
LLALKPVVVIFGVEETWKDGNKTGETGDTGTIDEDTAGCLNVGVGILTGGAKPEETERSLVVISTIDSEDTEPNCRISPATGEETIFPKGCWVIFEDTEEICPD